MKTGGMCKIRVVTQTLIKDAFELHDYEQEMLSRGYEGVMLRDPSGLYKQGRSTLKEGGLMKVKKFLDAEAEIQDVIELQHNENEQILDELGRSKRSSHKAGKRAGGKMGALSVRNVVNGVSFEIGAGFTDEDREWFWRHRKEAVRLRWWIKYRYFPSGSKDKPRFPVYVGLRHLNDL
jgi:DNA ligase-1